MKRSLLLLAFGVSMAFAQGGPGGPGGNTQSGPRLSGRPDIARLQTIEGTIASINLGVGLRSPSIGINGLVIRVAPLWYLLENDFELVVGEQVRIVAAVSTQAGDPYLHAVSGVLPAGLAVAEEGGHRGERITAAPAALGRL